ncbi:hypothetical protein MMC21_002723 [Puttea exsequens]|nr:hypothetical protein [Puttea exsequens]
MLHGLQSRWHTNSCDIQRVSLVSLVNDQTTAHCEVQECGGKQARPRSAISSWMAVDQAIWNSITGQIIGLYKDGSIFKWHPMGGETQEARVLTGKVEVSLDGKLFITSDSNGAAKAWNFAFFGMIHQLSSGDLVSGLAFSSDGGRFYDLRGSSINIWEPNSLISLSESEDWTMASVIMQPARKEPSSYTIDIRERSLSF